MKLSLLDWSIIAAYFLFNLGIGIYYARRARGSTTEFFLSGRNVPWWLAGTSMVATTFAADTPLAVTGFVAKNGIAGNWIWWNFVMSGMLTVQFVNWFLGCFLIYAFLFGIGYVIFGEMLKGGCFLLAGAIASAAILRNLRRTDWQSVADELPRTGEAIVAKAVES